MTASGDEDMELAKWRQKVPLEVVLDPNYDGRKVTGLATKIENLINTGKPRERMLASVLKNYHNMLQQLRSLAKSNISTMHEDDLQQKLQVVVDERLSLPQPLMRALLVRQCDKQMEDHKFAELLVCMSPFVPPTVFDCRQPCLSGIPCDKASHLKTFQELVVETLLVNWMIKGREASSQVVSFCKVAIEAFADADVLTMDAATAKDFGEYLCIWRSLVALASDDLDLAYQE